ncbi:MAG: hypothetical protein HYR67_14925 [Bacteroidetes bacterium]|nr:hypothetical protein [Bacteroidota bacterium]
MKKASTACKHKNCSVCGNSFTCGAVEEDQWCWCNDFPAIMPLDFDQDCRCPECLKKVVKEKDDRFIKTLPPENAVKSIAKNYVDTGKLVEGIDYYIENDRWVFTEWYLLKQGHCCNSGCKHCPYASIG